MAQLASFSSNTESLLHYPAKRLNYVLLIATLLHLLVLLTVNINPIMQALHLKQPNQQLAVSLTLIEDLPPKLANYIGLKNHSGSLDNNESMAEAIPYIFNQESMADQKHVITTDTPTQQQVVKHNIISQAQAVASTLIQDLRHLPKKKIISAATHQHEDAAYLYRWQQYIESIASETYPQQAIENNITGQLRLLVALKPDGSVHDVTIRQSSGQEILDNAALNIVQKAQPFEPIPPDMLQNNEIIEIIRTWDFRGTLRVAS